MIMLSHDTRYYQPHNNSKWSDDGTCAQGATRAASWDAEPEEEPQLGANENRYTKTDLGCALPPISMPVCLHRVSAYCKLLFMLACSMPGLVTSLTPSTKLLLVVGG